MHWNIPAFRVESGLLWGDGKPLPARDLLVLGKIVPDLPAIFAMIESQFESMWVSMHVYSLSIVPDISLAENDLARKQHLQTRTQAFVACSKYICHCDKMRNHGKHCQWDVAESRFAVRQYIEYRYT